MKNLRYFTLFLLACLCLLGPFAECSAQERADSEGWRSLFDGKTLENWEKTNFGGEGDVFVEDESIVLSYGEMLTGVTWKADFPKSNYEVRLEAQRLSGMDFFCGLTFPVKDEFCSFIVAGWGGVVVGLSSIDGFDASENETSVGMAFDNKRWYRIRVQVTDERIQAWIDDEEVVNVKTKDREFSVRPEVRLSRPFGIASYQTEAALRNIEVRELDRP